jgi:hypothetical protein
MKAFSPPGEPSLKKPDLLQDGLVPVRLDKRKNEQDHPIVDNEHSLLIGFFRLAGNRDLVNCGLGSH